MGILKTKLGNDLVKEMSINHNETLHYKKIQHQTFEKTQKLLNQSSKLKSNSNSKSPKSSNISFTNKNKTKKNEKKESLRNTQRKLDQEGTYFLADLNL